MLVREAGLDVYYRKFRNSWAWVDEEWCYIIDFYHNEDEEDEQEIVYKYYDNLKQSFTNDTEPEYKALLPGIYGTTATGPVLIKKNLLKSYLVGINFEKNYVAKGLVLPIVDSFHLMNLMDWYKSPTKVRDVLVIDKFWYIKAGDLFNMGHKIGSVIDDRIKSLYPIPDHIKQAIHDAL
jgi:hypothetical protein